MSTNLGSQAETLAAQYLQNLGFKVHYRNHRTRYSELDIVAERGGVIHFVEVKYRSNPDFGGGLEYVTNSKIKRLERAAKAFMHDLSLSQPFQIDALSVEGDLEKPTLTLIENITG